ncbi:MAG: alkaline phosphatase, partial [Anaerolineae bacterium]
VVTGDHETGGMTIGFAGTRYDTFFEKVEKQTMSYEAFDKILAEYKETHTVENASLEDLLPEIEKAFGLTTTPDQDLSLSALELEVIEQAFQESMLGVEERAADEYTYLLYGGYEPLTVKLTTILNQKAGISWTSYSHTGIPVQTSALGVGAELFNGYYDQTDVHTKMRRIAGL